MKSGETGSKCQIRNTIEQPGQTFTGLVKAMRTQPLVVLKRVKEEHPDQLERVLEMQRQAPDPQSDMMLRRLSGMRRAANQAKISTKALPTRNMARLFVAYAKTEIGSLRLPSGWAQAMQHVLIERGCGSPTTGSIRTLRVRLLDYARANKNQWDLTADQFEWLKSQL